MKKILTLVCAMMLGIGFANAQVHKGETAAGLNLVYGSEIENLGLGARFQYGILDQLRAEVGFNYFFEKNHMSWWDVNINAHYLLGLWNEQLYIYPLAGMNYTMVDFKGELDDKGEQNHVGLNLGAGIEYEINDHFGVNFEYRHTIIRKVDQGVFGLGINYKF
jgi:outer membrane protein X